MQEFCSVLHPNYPNLFFCWVVDFCQIFFVVLSGACRGVDSNSQLPILPTCMGDILFFIRYHFVQICRGEELCTYFVWELHQHTGVYYIIFIDIHLLYMVCHVKHNQYFNRFSLTERQIVVVCVGQLFLLFKHCLLLIND